MHFFSGIKLYKCRNQLHGNILPLPQYYHASKLRNSAIRAQKGKKPT